MSEDICGIELGLNPDEAKQLRERIARGGQDFEKTARDLAEQEVIKKKIAKRNAALNLQRKLEIVDYVNRVWEDKPELGLQSVLVGSNRARQGSRQSVAAEQNSRVNYYTQSFLADVEETGFWKEFVSGAYDDEIAQAMWDAGNGKDISKYSDVAKSVAPILEKWNEFSRGEANAAGAWVGKESGYIVRQSHDQKKIRKAARQVGGEFTNDENINFQAWRDYVLPLLDTNRTFGDTEGLSTDKFLRSVYDGLYSGLHMANTGGGASKSVPAGFASLAKRMSHDRILHFKDGKSWSQYNKTFGSGSLRESMLFGLERQARNTALMEKLGPNPQMTLDNIKAELEKTAAKKGAQGRVEFQNRMKAVENWMAELDGSVNIPANAMGASISANIRAIQSMAKLGGAVISSVSDLANIGGELRYQGKSYLSGYSAALDGLVAGKNINEKNQILGMLGVSMRGMAGNAVHRFSAQDDLSGTMSRAMRTFFKWNGLTWWTDSLRQGAAFAMSKNLADNVGRGFNKLNLDMQRVLGLFDIDGGMWDMMRKSSLYEADGDKFFTPEMARTIPDDDIKGYLSEIGKKPTAANIRNTRNEIERKFRNYFTDRVEYAVIEPDARVRTISKLGTQPGTPEGEFMRFIMQFKSFPTAMLLKPLSRELYGRGIEADSFTKAIRQALKNGNGEMMGIAQLFVQMTALGYLAMSAKDMLKGREPRDPLNQKTWMAAATQGGGLGIYGDFLFGDMKNRFGGGALQTLAGPTFGTGEDIINIIQKIRDGDDAAAETLNTIISNTPFANMFYTRMALDYLIIYRIKEAMNSGYLKRMERRIEKENSQEFMIKPSEIVR